jgi:hypothetical protein
MSSQPLNPQPGLTFGVEFELAIATLAKGFVDANPGDPRQVKGLTCYLDHPAIFSYDNEIDDFEYREWFLQLRIADLFNAAGFPAITHREIKLKERYEDEDWSEKRLTYWIIDQDASIREPDGFREYDWYGIEINSPAFYFSEDAVDAVKKVCKLLRNTYRINVNESTGMHVHVGHGCKIIDTPHLRALMALLFVFEPQLDMLHPSHRSDNGYSYPLDSHSILGKSKGLTRRQKLEALLAMHDREEILEIMRAPRPGPHLAYNIKPMCPGETKRTIEFRQHESTLEADRVAAWIRLCVGLVEYPLRHSRENIEGLLREHVDQSVADFNVIDALLALELHDSANFYDRRLHALWVNAGRRLPIPDNETPAESDTDHFGYL